MLQTQSQHVATVTFSPGFRRMLPFILIIFTLNGGRRILESFQPPDLYRKDFIQEYLMAKAILEGVNPYLPLPDLIDRWIGVNKTALLHPTPHPPIVGILSLPLGFLDYRSAALTWLGIELLCLTGAIILLMEWWGARITTVRLVIALGAALGWMPVIEELWLGQFSAMLLLLLLAAWSALRKEQDGKAGAFLGLMLALKFSGWPLLLFLLIRRRWNAVIAAGIVFLLANLIPLFCLGIQCVSEYYLKVAPLISEIYRHHEGNLSAWTIGQRVFNGFGVNMYLQPLVASSLLTKAATILIPIGALLSGLWLALKAKSFDTAVGIMTIIGIWINPISWTHYLVLSAIPSAIIAKRLSCEGWPKDRCYRLIGILLSFTIAISTYLALAGHFTNQSTPDGLPVVPFAAGLLILIPVAGLGGLLWMIWRSDQTETRTEPGYATTGRRIAAFS
jgi:hypothetical protein